MSTEIGTGSTVESLPFSQAKQEALFGWLLTDPKFFLLAKTRIRTEWWTVMRLQQLWDMAINFCDHYNRPPTYAELSECRDIVTSGMDEVNRFRSIIKLCVDGRRQDFGLDVLQGELTEWFKTRIYVTAMKRSETLFNMVARGSHDTKKLAEAFQILRDMNKEIDDASFEPTHIETMEIEDIEGQRLDAKQAVDFGLPKLNKFLNPEAEGTVGLLKGDMTVLLAPTNVGKTTTMVTVAVMNLIAGRDVLLITHEGRIGDIKLKIWQCMMGDTRQNLMSNLSNPEYRSFLQHARDIMAKHLEFMPLNKAGMTVEEVDAIIRRRQERWQSAHMGKGFDLVVDDYAAKLTTQQAKGGQFALRHIHEVVYNYFSQIALEHNVHVLTAIQTNREGSKVNNRQTRGHESRFLTLEDVMESWGPMTTATNVISINRPPEAQARGLTGFLLCKSRSSETGVLFLAEGNFGQARSHFPDWKCEEYKISSLNNDRVSAILEEFQPVEKLAEAA